MKQYVQSITLTTGLAIFAMLFGAGNLIFPPKVGVLSGTQTALGLFAFILTSVFLPLTGLVGMVFFDGDYKAFFHRIGTRTGDLLILFCMLTLGPLLVMPRIVGLTYELISPFAGNACPILWFSLFFALLTFVCCYHKDKVVALLGKILSPLKLLSMAIIITFGLWFHPPAVPTALNTSTVFWKGFTLGYSTLDLLGMIFFAFIILSALKRTLHPEQSADYKILAKIVMRGGLIGGFLLALVYIGLGYLGTFHGQGLEQLDPGKLFSETVIRILGNKGALFIIGTVLVACLSTMVALASVVSDYVRTTIFNRSISYTSSLILVLLTTTCIAQFKLGPLLQYSEPLLLIGYPVIIVLTFCNIAHKLWGFMPIKIPVLLTLALSTYIYGPEFIKLMRYGLPKHETPTVELA